jgi:uncharacterized membrane protein YphA (DoxX/SURF4 family)
MSTFATRDPGFVQAILDWRWTWLAARIALTGPYLLGGTVKLVDFQGAVAEQLHFGLHPAEPLAALTIAVELVGPCLVLSGRLVWLGAGMLGVFTGLAALVADAFWTMQGEARFAATNAFFEHIALIAGLVLAALLADHARRGASAARPA